MITSYLNFKIPTPPGLHQRGNRPELVATIRAATGGATLDRCPHRTVFKFYGEWCDIDNHMKVLFDAMAEAFGLGLRGRGDNLMMASGAWETFAADSHWVEIEICRV